VRNAGWERGAEGWALPPFAHLEGPGAGGVRSIVVEGQAEGAVAQTLDRPEGFFGRHVIAVGYARVESAHAIEATDEDVTPKLWEGALALANGYVRWRGGFESPYVQVRFTGREAASGAWKRFVTPPMAVWRARRLYPHFAFWQTRLAPGVRVHLAALSLVEVGSEAAEEPETAVECPGLAAPAPVLENVPRAQWVAGRAPDGAFEEFFELAERANARTPGEVELVLSARYRQGPNRADRFLVAVTQDGSDPRLSPTSQVAILLARRGEERWETAVSVRKNVGPLRIAVAAAAQSTGGLRVQTPVYPPAWQRPRA
jgi:hypothetical protein